MGKALLSANTKLCRPRALQGLPATGSQAGGCLQLRREWGSVEEKPQGRRLLSPRLSSSTINSLHRSSLRHSQRSLLLRAVPSTPVQSQPGWRFVHQSKLNLFLRLSALLQLPGSGRRWCSTAALAQAARWLLA